MNDIFMGGSSFPRRIQKGTLRRTNRKKINLLWNLVYNNIEFHRKSGMWSQFCPILSVFSKIIHDLGIRRPIWWVQSIPLAILRHIDPKSKCMVQIKVSLSTVSFTLLLEKRYLKYGFSTWNGTDWSLSSNSRLWSGFFTRHGTSGICPGAYLKVQSEIYTNIDRTFR